MQTLDDDIAPMFERFLQLPAGNLELALSEAADLVAAALAADKVDVFVYHPHRASLHALGTSHQPLSKLQREAGLDVLPLANGGLIVETFRSRVPLLVSTSIDNPAELRGVRELLRLESQIAVPLDIGGRAHGVLAVASQARHHWSARHLRFAQAVARWVGIVAHRAELVAELERRSLAEGRRAAAEELVTMVAHDLRNHLGPLRLRLDALSRRADRDRREDDRRDVGQALASVVRISAFISDLLDVARLDRDLFDLSPVPLDITALARDVADAASSRQRRVRVEARGEVRVVADPFRIRQCLENLVANAVAHTPRGGTVTVQVGIDAAEPGGRARVAVLDDGPGIAEQVLPHIFERYVSGRRAERGLGLGLYIAKQVATLHGGDLTAASGLGGGACFVLTLPCQA